MKIELERKELEVKILYRSCQSWKNNEDDEGGELLAYFFRLPRQEHARAHSMLGSNCTARLYYMPQGEVFHLNKVRLASLPEGKKCSSWQELLEKVHPDLELVVNGETELIVRKK